jgi:sporulation protein YlmC with PRC-barrel domain
VATEPTVSVTKKLRGASVLHYDSEEEIGRVVDVVVHPTEGRMLALLVATSEGARRVIRTNDCTLREDAVLAVPYSAVGGDTLRLTLASGVLAGKRLLGMEIVADRSSNVAYSSGRGEYLGHIRDVLVVPSTGSVVYRVTDAPTGSGEYFLAGSVPCCYSRLEEQVEVPRHTAARFAPASPLEAMELAEPTSLLTVH